MRRAWFVAVITTALATPAHAQFVVIDSGNLAQAVLIAERTVREYETLMAEYQTLVRMSQGLGNMDPYRIPTLPGTAHEAAPSPYGGPWIEGPKTRGAT